MNYNTDSAVMPFIMVAIIIFESVFTLLSIFKKGVMKDQRKLLLKKTNKELKKMLTGVKRISNLNKSQLVELVIEHA